MSSVDPLDILLPLHRLDVPTRLKRIVERMVKRANVKLRPIRMSKLEDELKIVQEVYNSTLERNWGFMPVTIDELLATADDMRAFADPKMMLIAEVNGENAGVALRCRISMRSSHALKKLRPAEAAAHSLADEDAPHRLGSAGRSRNLAAVSGSGPACVVDLRAVCLCPAAILQCDDRLDRGKQQRDHREFPDGWRYSTAGVEDL